jgi:hypothetical protein
MSMDDHGGFKVKSNKNKERVKKSMPFGRQ